MNVSTAPVGVIIKEFHVEHPYEKIVDSLFDGVKQVVVNVCAQAQVLAPVDTGLLRNSILWSMNGKEYGGANAYPSTAPPSSTWENKGHTPIGNGAKMAESNHLIKFPQNSDIQRVIGYVGTNVKYGIYQEFGTRYVSPQPFLRPAVAVKGRGENPKLVIKRTLQENSLGPLMPGQERIII